MKVRFNKILLMLALMLFATSCGESFLELTPINTRNTTNAFQTEEDIELAVRGIYDSMQERFFAGATGIPAGHGMFAADIMSMGEHRSDNTYPPNNGLDQFWNDSWNDFSRFRLTSENNILWDFYFKAYQGIRAANLVLDKIESVEMDEEVRSRYVGEVHFLRGFFYYYLALNFGGVPLITASQGSPEDAYALSRSSAEETFTQAIADLEIAAEQSPEKSDYDSDNLGRATKGAALGFIGKAYLQQSKWGEAIEAFDRLMTLGTYRLNDDFTDSFNGELANINPESIFEVQFKFDPTGSGETGRYATWSTFYEVAAPSTEVVNSFYPNDLRKDLTIGTGGSPPRNAFIKYPNFEQTPFLDGIYGGDNYVALRYADILLSYAEAENELNGPTPKAFQMLNEVHAHSRTGLSSFSATDLPDQASFRTELRRTRRAELAWEGHRWYDLQRYGSAYMLETMNRFLANKEGGKSMEEYQILYPIPQPEIDLNTNITQNAGW